MEEDLFRQAKSLLRTCTIYHSSDAAIRGHVFCSFLAMVIRTELMKRWRARGETLEWLDIPLDLDPLQESTIIRGPHSYILRTEATGTTASLFKVARLALPLHVTTEDPTRRKRRPTRLEHAAAPGVERQRTDFTNSALLINHLAESGAQVGPKGDVPQRLTKISQTTQ